MQKKEKEYHGFEEDIEIECFDIPVPGKFKKGKMSPAFEAALDAVENMEKKDKN